MKFISIVCLSLSVVLCMSCGNKPKQESGSDSTAADATATSAEATLVPVIFSADSAYAFCEAQCQFGPRIMNSEAHEQCGSWIVRQFQRYGLQVIEQRATLKGYDGTPLLSNNIIAQYRPELTDRIIICAHWDSRPWADNDPDSTNWRKPVMAANDGASGVAVMLELARLISDPKLGEVRRGLNDEQSDAGSDPQPPNLGGLDFGIDFICFDAEDWGTPQWSDAEDDGNTYALGAQYWAAHPHRQGYKARFGILVDMVGGQNARFYQESFSLHYAKDIVNSVWQAAKTAGYSGFFPMEEGGAINDDHVPVNQTAGIPCIDIIHHVPTTGFGPTWHTLQDDMQHIDRSTLKAVGQTLVQYLWTLK